MAATKTDGPWRGCAITIATRRSLRRARARAAGDEDAAQADVRRCRLAIAGGRADSRRHGAGHGAGPRGRHVLRGLADRWRHGPDVPADGRLSCRTLAAAARSGRSAPALGL